jgi:16S rRNA processing protein RimM
MAAPADAYVTLARILRPRGNKGEVAAEILTDFPGRLVKRREVFLWDGRNAPRKTVVRVCWLHGDRAVFHFEGCDSITAAEKLRGLEVQAPLAERAALPAGQYFVTDLIGCSVFEIFPASALVSSPPRSTAAAPVFLGTVRDVQSTGEGVAGTPFLEVETQRGELLIPLAEEICSRIDTAARRIEVSLPKGLSDLNREKP